MHKRSSVYTGRALARRAICDGKRLGPHSFELDYSGSCDNPCLTEYTCTNDHGAGVFEPYDVLGGPVRPQIGIFVNLLVRCRKCAPCRKSAQRAWQHRALAEFENAVRTWFVTLTFEEWIHVETMYRLVEKSDGAHQSWSPEHRFSKLASALSERVTLYLKRLRQPLKKFGWEKTSFRYLLVAEAHKSDHLGFHRPHFHLLVHETGVPLVHKRLKHQWIEFESPIMHARLAKRGDVAYTVKYITKEDRLARCRASLSYGSPPQPGSAAKVTHDLSTATTTTVQCLGNASTDGSDIDVEPYQHDDDNYFALNDCVDPSTGEPFVPFFGSKTRGDYHE